MKKISKFAIGSMALCSCLLSSVPTYAANDTVKMEAVMSENENIGVGPVVPLTRSVEAPIHTWNVANEGRYEFEGSSGGDDLYTNYLITGQSKYQIVCKNESSSKDMYFKVLGKRYKVAAGTTTTLTIQTTASKKFYILFEAPCYFTGHIG